MPSEALPAPAPVPKAARSLSGWLGNDPTVTLLGSLIVLSACFFGIRTPGSFLSGETARAMFFQMPELGILALAMMIPLMSGGLNLAIIATANLAALTMAAVLTKMLTHDSSPQAVAGIIALALAAGLVVCLLIGLLTGSIVAYLGAHPILVTLGTMTAVKGISVYATSGGVIGGFPAPILYLGNGSLLGVPVPMLLFLLCAAVVAVIINRVPFGVAVRMLGSNEKATRYSGVNTARTLVGVYVASSVLCWVGSLVMMARFNSASAGYAESYLLITILAAVLGGIDPNGGFGTVLGLFLSLVLLQIISTGFNLLGFSSHLTQAIWGATMIVAIALALVRDGWIARRWLRQTAR